MIFVMMVVTTIDVIGRDVFNLPLFGAFEMTEILMGLVIFAGMPLDHGGARAHHRQFPRKRRLAARPLRPGGAWRCALRGGCRGHGLADLRPRRST